MQCIVLGKSIVEALLERAGSELTLGSGLMEP